MNADRVVRIPPERLSGWVERFAARHGKVVVGTETEAVALTAADGAVATMVVPFPPLPDSPDPLATLLDHAARQRLVGALLVRRGGYAVGVFSGRELRSSKVGPATSRAGPRPAAGRNNASPDGGNQADRSYAGAAAAAYAVLVRSRPTWMRW